MTELLDARDVVASPPRPEHPVVLGGADAARVLEHVLGGPAGGGQPVVVIVGTGGLREAVDATRGSTDALVVEPTTGEARIAGRVVPTSALESAVLRVLAERRGSVVPRAEIMQRIWPLDPDGKSGNLDNALLRLRRKIERDPGRPRHLVTVWGKGILLESDGPAS